MNTKMNKNIIVPERKFKIGDKEYTFRFDFAALLRMEEKFGKESVASLYAYLGKGEKIFETGIMILVASCVERDDLTKEEVISSLPLDMQTLFTFDELLGSLMYGVTSDSNEGESDTKKKQK